MTADIRVYHLKRGQLFSFERDDQELIGVVLSNNQRLILSPAPPRFPRRVIENYHASPYHGAKLVPHRVAADRAANRPTTMRPSTGQIVVIMGRDYMYLVGANGTSDAFIDIEKWESAVPLVPGRSISEIVQSWELHDGHGAVVCRFPE